MQFLKKRISNIQERSFDRSLVVFLCILLLLYLLYAYFIEACRSSVEVDEGYYMGVVNLLYKGLVPYRDFELGYTPLLFYVLLPLRAIMGALPVISSYKLLICLVSFANALLLAVLLKRITKTGRVVTLFFSVLFLVFWLYLQGAKLLLEPLSVFWGLCAMLFVTRKKAKIDFVLAGAFAALALLTKQYGLVFVGCIGVYLLCSTGPWKEMAGQCALFALGFCAVVGAFCSVYGLLGVSPAMLLASLSGSGYGSQSFYGYKLGLVKAVRVFPFLLLLPCLLLKMKREDCSAMALGVTGVVLSSFQLYFNVFPHYYLYMLPFVFLLSAMIFVKLRTEIDSKVILFLFWGMLFTSSALLLQDVWTTTKYYQKADVRKTTTDNAKQIDEVIKKHRVETTLCYWGTIEYYGLCSLTPPLIKKYGYSFGNETEETMCERLLDSDSFVVSEEGLEYLKKIMPVFCSQLQRGYYVPEGGNVSTILVFIKEGK